MSKRVAAVGASLVFALAAVLNALAAMLDAGRWWQFAFLTVLFAGSALAGFVTYWTTPPEPIERPRARTTVAPRPSPSAQQRQTSSAHVGTAAAQDALLAERPSSADSLRRGYSEHITQLAGMDGVGLADVSKGSPGTISPARSTTKPSPLTTSNNDPLFTVPRAGLKQRSGRSPDYSRPTAITTPRSRRRGWIVVGLVAASLSVALAIPEIDYFWRAEPDIAILEGHTGMVEAVVFSKDGKRLFSAGRDRAILIWDTFTREYVEVLTGHDDGVFALALSPNGKVLVSGSADKTIRTWDAVTGAPGRTFTGHSGAIQSLTFSPDGDTIFSASWDKTVRAWDMESGKSAIIPACNKTGEWSADVAVAPDGKKLACRADDSKVRIVDVQSLRATAVLAGVGGALAFSRDSRILATGSDDWNYGLIKAPR